MQLQWEGEETHPPRPAAAFVTARPSSARSGSGSAGARRREQMEPEGKATPSSPRPSRDSEGAPRWPAEFSVEAAAAAGSRAGSEAAPWSRRAAGSLRRGRGGWFPGRPRSRCAGPPPPPPSPALPRRLAGGRGPAGSAGARAPLCPRPRRGAWGRAAPPRGGGGPAEQLARTRGRLQLTFFL